LYGIALLQVKSPRIMPDRTPSGWKIDLFNNAVNRQAVWMAKFFLVLSHIR